ncbi:DUF6230 family protein [Corynebacterium massiliense]|uniref:Cholesterol esterase n=1 Tax=Corynebacterium massiliense DSM 45435 TaxID=1121364 RepID=A0ABY7U5T4_9CORY|nr:DUF6230 family protein [Corynebacterium massiliense]WCZ32062.1 hypothetical protein CMASS_03035 [Corynebacterium massiliense DSM 45435]
MGRIRKRRFAAIAAAGLIALSAEGVAMANNGLAAGLALSNTIFTQTVGGLDADDFGLFVDTEHQQQGDRGVTRLRLQHAEITDMCLSAKVNLPGVGEKKFQMLADGPSTTADNLVIGVADMEGSLTMTNPRIGVDASQLSDDAEPGAFGLAATHMEASDQVIHAVSTSADRLSSAGGKITVEDPDGGRC